MMRYNSDETDADGKHTVILAGSVALGGPPILWTYKVPEPSRFAEVVFTEALKEKGITADFERRRQSRIRGVGCYI